MAISSTYKIRVSIKKIRTSASSPIDAMAVAFSHLPQKSHKLVSGMSAKREKAPKPKKGEKAPPAPRTGQRTTFLVNISVKNILVEAHNAMSASQSAINGFPEHLRQLVASISIINYGLSAGVVNVPGGWEMFTPTTADEQEEWEETCAKKRVEAKRNKNIVFMEDLEKLPEKEMQIFFQEFESKATDEDKKLFDKILGLLKDDPYDSEAEVYWRELLKRLAVYIPAIALLHPKVKIVKYIAVAILRGFPRVSSKFMMTQMRFTHWWFKIFGF